MFPLPGFCCKNSYICWLLPYLFGVVPQSYVSGLGLSPQKVCLIKHNSQLTFRLWFFFFHQLTEAFLIFSSALGLLLWKILRGISLRVEGRLPAWYPKRWIGGLNIPLGIFSAALLSEIRSPAGHPGAHWMSDTLHTPQPAFPGLSLSFFTSGSADSAPFPGGSAVKNPPADAGDPGSIPGLVR